MNWDAIQKGASALWRVALAALLGTLTWQAYNLRHAPAWAQAQLQREGDATRQAALTAIADTRKDLLAEVGRARADLKGQVAALRVEALARVDTGLDKAQAAIQDATRRADARLSDIAAKADAQLGRVNDTVAGLRSDVQPLVKPVQNTLDVVSENADLLGRCATVDPDTGEVIGNVDCLANRLIPAMKAGERAAGSVERMAKAVEQETPATAKALRQTSQDLAIIADRLARPVSWIRGVLTTAAKAAFKFIGF